MAQNSTLLDIKTLYESMAGGRIFIHLMDSMRDSCKRTLLLREMNYFLLILMTHKSLKNTGIRNSPAIRKNNISISYLPLHHDADCLCSDFNLFSNICVNGFQKFLLCLLKKNSNISHSMDIHNVCTIR
jgi:hypothetical protein